MGHLSPGACVGSVSHSVIHPVVVVVVVVLVRRSGVKAGVWYCTSTEEGMSHHGSPSKLQNHARGQIDSLPAVMEFLGSLTTSS